GRDDLVTPADLQAAQDEFEGPRARRDTKRVADAAVAGEPALKLVDVVAAHVRRSRQHRFDLGVDTRFQRDVLLAQVDERNPGCRCHARTARYASIQRPAVCRISYRAATISGAFRPRRPASSGRDTRSASAAANPGSSSLATSRPLTPSSMTTSVAP